MTSKLNVIRFVGPMLSIAVSFTLLAGCAAGNDAAPKAQPPESPGAPSPGPTAPAPGPRSMPEEPECKSDADCAEGSTCVATIRAACDTCDGGKVVHLCR
jgi:hypothetical protein